MSKKMNLVAPIFEEKVSKVAKVLSNARYVIILKLYQTGFMKVFIMNSKGCKK
jgi:hypothetical protein